MYLQASMPVVILQGETVLYSYGQCPRYIVVYGGPGYSRLVITKHTVNALGMTRCFGPSQVTVRLSNRLRDHDPTINLLLYIPRPLLFRC